MGCVTCCLFLILPNYDAALDASYLFQLNSL